MKVIFLNIWGGQVFEPLMQFIKESANSTDFFCFQEMLDSPNPGLTPWKGRTDIRKKLREALPEFQEYYAPSHNILDKNGTPDPNISVGVGIFTKKGIKIKSHTPSATCTAQRTLEINSIPKSAWNNQKGLLISSRKKKARKSSAETSTFFPKQRVLE